jgi:hypothetical protein
MIALMAGPEFADGAGTRHGAVVSLRMADGDRRLVALEQLTVDQVAAAAPFRRFRAWRGQRHMPGLYWSATMAGHVAYESRLELAVLQVADFDPAVVGIYSQPFQLCATDSGGQDRSWVPDFLLALDDGSLVLVEVKPAIRAATPAIAGRLAFFGAVVSGCGLRFEVRSEPDPVLLANVVFLAGYRRRGDFDSSILEAVSEAVIRGVMLMANLESSLATCWPSSVVRPHLLHLLWSGVLRTDLSRVLSCDSMIWRRP